ncbi:MAG: hypothetical protein ACRCX2_32420 [Paraclostridium sp.]
MILRENDSTKGNSITFNSSTDDLTTVNYLALAYCIAGVETNRGIEYPSIAVTCSAFNLYEQQTRKKKTTSTKGIPVYSKRIIVKATNVITGEEKEFLGIEEASKYTGASKGNVTYYTSGRATKKAHTQTGWRFEKVKQVGE